MVSSSDSTKARVRVMVPDDGTDIEETFDIEETVTFDIDSESEDSGFDIKETFDTGCHVTVTVGKPEVQVPDDSDAASTQAIPYREKKEEKTSVRLRLAAGVTQNKSKSE